jgi:hypothetical protein
MAIFVEKLENKLSNSRLDFLFEDKSRDISFEETVKQFIGFSGDPNANRTYRNS